MAYLEDLFSVAGKTALVTGAATGIGRMAATGLVLGGARAARQYGGRRHVVYSALIVM
jgi:NAD(P)-dependent dehydrogenase (short-subunit alcohol dehydrogenase family)